MVKRKAAEHQEQAYRLESEAKEKKEDCTQGKVALAKVLNRRIVVSWSFRTHHTL